MKNWNTITNSARRGIIRDTIAGALVLVLGAGAVGYKAVNVAHAAAAPQWVRDISQGTAEARRAIQNRSDAEGCVRGMLEHIPAEVWQAERAEMNAGEYADFVRGHIAASCGKDPENRAKK